MMQFLRKFFLFRTEASKQHEILLKRMVNEWDSFPEEDFKRLQMYGEITDSEQADQYKFTNRLIYFCCFMMLLVSILVGVRS